MITLYYVQEISKNHISPASGLLYDDKKQLENRMKQLSNGFISMYDNDRYEIKTIEVDEKCKCDDYMQTTMILIKVEEDENITMVGSDNYMGIHEKVGFSFDADIESCTNGYYQLMSRKYFNDNYKIKTKH